MKKVMSKIFIMIFVFSLTPYMSKVKAGSELSQSHTVKLHKNNTNFYNHPVATVYFQQNGATIDLKFVLRSTKRWWSNPNQGSMQGPPNSRGIFHTDFELFNLDTVDSQYFNCLGKSYIHAVNDTYLNETVIVTNRYSIKPGTRPTEFKINDIQIKYYIEEIDGKGNNTTIPTTDNMSKATIFPIDVNELPKSKVTTQYFDANTKKSIRSNDIFYAITGEQINKTLMDLPHYDFSYRTINGKDKSESKSYTTTVPSDITVEAYYIPKNYTIQYDANGGITPPSSDLHPYNSTISVKEIGEMSYEGYKFLHWNTKSDGSGTNYQPAETFTVDGDRSLYAIWEKIPEMLVEKKATSENARPGDVVTYTITVKNNSKKTKSKIVFEDSMQDIVLLVKKGSATIASNGRSAEINNLASYEEVIFTYDYIVSKNAKHGDVIENIAKASDGEGNEAKDTHSLQIIKTLELLKTSSKKQVKPGETIDYTIALTNPSESSINNILLVDTMQDITLTTQHEGVKINKNMARISTLEAGKTIVFSYEYTVPKNNYPKQIVNSVTATTSEEEAKFTNVVDVGLDFIVKKTANKDTAKAGDVITYKVEIENVTDEEIVLFRFRDSLKDIEITSDYKNIMQSGDEIIVYSMPANSSISFHYEYKIPSTIPIGTKFVNTATVIDIDENEISDTHSVMIDGKPIVYYDANDGAGTLVDKNSPYKMNSTVTVLHPGQSITKDGFEFMEWNDKKDGSGKKYSPGSTFNITEDIIFYAQWKCIPNVSVKKTAHSDNAQAGTKMAYSVVVKNEGSCSLNNLIVKDDLDVDLVPVGVSDDIVVTGKGSARTIHSLAAGKYLCFYYVYDIPMDYLENTLTNTVTVSQNNQIIAEDSVVVDVNNDNFQSLSIEKKLESGSLKDEDEFIIKLSNPNDHYTFTLNKANDWKETKLVKKGIYSMAEDMSKTYEFVSFTGEGIEDNTLTISDEKRKITVTNKEVTGSLELRKTADKSSAKVGDLIHYEITLSNNTKQDMTNILVKDSLAVAIQVKEKPETTTIVNNDDQSLTIDVLKPGEKVILNYSYLVKEEDAGKVLTNKVNIAGEEGDKASAENDVVIEKGGGGGGGDDSDKDHTGELSFVKKLSHGELQEGDVFKLYLYQDNEIKYSFELNQKNNWTQSKKVAIGDYYLLEGAHKDYDFIEFKEKGSNRLNVKNHMLSLMKNDQVSIEVYNTKKADRPLVVKKTADRYAAAVGDDVTYTIEVSNVGNKELFDIELEDELTQIIAGVESKSNIKTQLEVWSKPKDVLVSIEDSRASINRLGFGDVVTFTCSIQITEDLKTGNKIKNSVKVSSQDGAEDSSSYIVEIVEPFALVHLKKVLTEGDFEEKDEFIVYLKKDKQMKYIVKLNKANDWNWTKLIAFGEYTIEELEQTGFELVSITGDHYEDGTLRVNSNETYELTIQNERKEKEKKDVEVIKVANKSVITPGDEIIYTVSIINDTDSVMETMIFQDNYITDYATVTIVSKPESTTIEVNENDITIQNLAAFESVILEYVYRVDPNADFGIVLKNIASVTANGLLYTDDNNIIIGNENAKLKIKKTLSDSEVFDADSKDVFTVYLLQNNIKKYAYPLTANNDWEYCQEVEAGNYEIIEEYDHNKYLFQGFSEAVENGTLTLNQNDDKEIIVENRKLLERPLEIIKTVDKHQAMPNDTLHYTILIKNKAKYPLTNVSFEDILKINETAVDGKDVKLKMNGELLESNPFTIPILLPEQMLTIDCEYTIPQNVRYGSLITNQITGKSDNMMENAKATTEIVPLLDLTKRANVKTIKPGEIVHYTIEIKNNGTEKLKNITLRDDKINNLVLEEKDKHKIQITTEKIVITELDPNETIVLKYSYQVPSNAQDKITNIAKVEDENAYVFEAKSEVIIEKNDNSGGGGGNNSGDKDKDQDKDKDKDQDKDKDKGKDSNEDKNGDQNQGGKADQDVIHGIDDNNKNDESQNHSSQNSIPEKNLNNKNIPRTIDSSIPKTAYLFFSSLLFILFKRKKFK